MSKIKLLERTYSYLTSSSYLDLLLGGRRWSLTLIHRPMRERFGAVHRGGRTKWAVAHGAVGVLHGVGPC